MPRRFLAEPEPEPAPTSDGVPAAHPNTDATMPTLGLDELVERFLGSTRFFARRQLRLWLPRPEAAIDDLDPIDLDPLLQYTLGNALFERLRAGATAAEAAEQLLANAALPVGIVGRLAADVLRVEVEEVARVGRARCSGVRLEDLDFELSLDAVPGLGRCRLVGRLDQLWPGGRIELGFSRLGRRAELAFWIRHLVLCALVDDGADVMPRSVFVGRAESKKSDDRAAVFEQVSNSKLHLARLFEWVWSTANAPLPFFPKTAWAFAAKAIAGNSDQAWRAAHQRFEGGEGLNFSLPESEEELESARIWEGWSPLASTGRLPVRFRFEELTLQFFEPFLEAREVHRE